MKNEIELGDMAKDTITGYIGVVVAFTKHITGCDRFILQAQLTEKDNSKLPDSYGFDVTTVELVKKAVVKVDPEVRQVKPVKRPGGPPTKAERI